MLLSITNLLVQHLGSIIKFGFCLTFPIRILYLHKSLIHIEVKYKTSFYRMNNLVTLLEKFDVLDSDLTRPWGQFYVIDEKQAQLFADNFFDGLDVNMLTIGGKLSPKILLVAPNQRLSWQYHNRRAEIWKVVEGPVAVKRSNTDEEGALVVCEAGEIIKLAQGERHRLIGLENQAIIAEIWQHTDTSYPSDENDIIRVQDDFGR
jgi:mannose-6-phosphate isomerase